MQTIWVATVGAEQPFQIPEPYSKPDLREYLELCRDEVEKQVPLVRLEDGSGLAGCRSTNSNCSFITSATYSTTPGS